MYIDFFFFAVKTLLLSTNFKGEEKLGLSIQAKAIVNLGFKVLATLNKSSPMN